MAQNRNYSKYPAVNRKFLSAGSSQLTGENFTFADVVTPSQDANRTNFSLLENTTRNVFDSPIATNNFNIIKLDIETGAASSQLKVRINQGLRSDNLATTYTTYIDPNTVFYRNYPVKNKFLNISLENESGFEMTPNVNVTLSKFTQYNSPAQNNDPIKRDQMVMLDRQTNDFEDDVALGYREDINIINRFGFIEKLNGFNDRLVAPIDIIKDNSNVYSTITCVSDSALDTFELEVSGNAISNTGRITNIFTMNGTGNSSGISNQFKSVDTIKIVDPTKFNTGNITINRQTTGEAVGFIPASFNNIVGSQYYINKFNKGVLREIGIRGNATMTGGELLVKVENPQGVSKTIWSQNINDAEVNSRWNPDITIESDNTVYISTKDVNTQYGDTYITAEMKIVEYNVIEDINKFA